MSRGSVLGLDPGERRVGVALAVVGAGVALPLATLQRTDGWLDRLADLAREHGATAVVVGLPVSLSGAEGPAAERARALAGEVASRLGLPVHLVDERLSTVAAGRALAAGGARGRRAAGAIDASAAAVILQAWLDGMAAAQSAS